tara:strand:- start:4714 stop:5022 length:309 start_codon:yes stop_codon:yes gene_type:complete
MRGKLFLLVAMLLLQACGGGSSGGGNNPAPAKQIDFVQLKQELSVRWQQVKPHCGCQSQKMKVLGALSQSILEEKGYQLSALNNSQNIRGFTEFISEIRREL